MENNSIAREDVVDDKCLICLNKLSMKVGLCCKHEFCLNCIKGYLIRSKQNNCPYCDAEIIKDIVMKIKNNPNGLSGLNVDKSKLVSMDVVWFYSNRLGNEWWFFNTSDIEILEDLYAKYSKGEDISQINSVSICGMTRRYDFVNMMQINDFNQAKRKIKRVMGKDMEEFCRDNKIKGISGLLL